VSAANQLLSTYLTMITIMETFKLVLYYMLILYYEVMNFTYKHGKPHQYTSKKVSRTKSLHVEGRAQMSSASRNKMTLKITSFPELNQRVAFNLDLTTHFPFRFGPLDMITIFVCYM